ncbi:MAG: acetate/propionate family kinase [Kofleriaceae bacterium]
MDLGLTILAINCGSSSLKFGVFDGEVAVRRGHAETIDEILELVDHPSAVGHRIVHGGPDHAAPAIVDGELLATLHRALPFAPLHLPIELAAIDAVRKRLPGVPQVACFDTAFHRTMPAVAHRYALPGALFDAGVRRYGFHGLSYEYLATVVTTTRRAVFAHLGNGASMVAIRDGAAIDTTMGLTPTGGLVMGTRSGDLDPGVMLYLLGQGYDARALATLITHESGLLALSSTTADMQKLLEARAHDPRAALAVEIFAYQAKKWLGAFVAVLGGIDTLVFTGGIGEHAPAIRSQICQGLGCLGIELDADLNAHDAPVIGRGTCEVRVVATDEEAMIARHTRELTIS